MVSPEFLALIKPFKFYLAPKHSTNVSNYLEPVTVVGAFLYSSPVENSEMEILFLLYMQEIDLNKFRHLFKAT